MYLLLRLAYRNAGTVAVAVRVVVVAAIVSVTVKTPAGHSKSDRAATVQIAGAEGDDAQAVGCTGNGPIRVSAPRAADGSIGHRAMVLVVNGDCNVRLPLTALSPHLDRAVQITYVHGGGQSYGHRVAQCRGDVAGGILGPAVEDLAACGSEGVAARWRTAPGRIVGIWRRGRFGGQVAGHPDIVRGVEGINRHRQRTGGFRQVEGRHSRWRGIGQGDGHRVAQRRGDVAGRIFGPAVEGLAAVAAKGMLGRGCSLPAGIVGGRGGSALRGQVTGHLDIVAGAEGQNQHR